MAHSGNTYPAMGGGRGRGRGRGRGGHGHSGRGQRGGVGFQPTPPQTNNCQGGPPAPQGARPQGGEGADAGAADMGTWKTHTKNGIIGMHATVAVSMCQNGTPAKHVHGNAARTIIRNHIHVVITIRIYKQDGCPARWKTQKISADPRHRIWKITGRHGE